MKKYHRLGKEVKEMKSKYMQYANKSMQWIRNEIEIANPYAIILLGEQVISSLLLCTEEEAREHMTGKVVEKKIIWKKQQFHLPPTSRCDHGPLGTKPLATQIRHSDWTRSSEGA